MEEKVEPTDQPGATQQDPPKPRSHRRLIVLSIVLLLIVIPLFLCWYFMISMPGESYAGPMPELNDGQTRLRDRLRKHVESIAGERNFGNKPGLRKAETYIILEFRDAGYEHRAHDYKVLGNASHNIEVEIVGSKRPKEIVVIGAHHDTVKGTPGANDNASGVAAVLELARHFANKRPERTLRFVTFGTEEPPWFQTENMGSLVYAKQCRFFEDNIIAAISLETIGYYNDDAGSQELPSFVLSPFYPSEGNFIAVVGNVGSRQLVLNIVDSFRRHAEFPSEGGALPGDMTGVGFSDHWSFWEYGYPAVMITDTAMFRYPYYHDPRDTPDKLDFDRMARVVDGLKPVIEELVNE